MTKRIVVTGANGRMGQEVVRTIAKNDDLELVGAVDIINIGDDINSLLGLEASVVEINDDLAQTLDSKPVDVVVDFTNPQIVMDNIKVAIEKEVDIVVGATGITEVDLVKIKEWNHKSASKVVIVPNFAIGAILMMQFAKKAAKFMNNVEIIELHHDKKLDAPSGTAIKTAELINQNLSNKEKKVDEIEKIKGARGGEKEGVNIHSVRLPGLVAHQEVLFGGVGQTLSIRHDSINRESFMPGVELAIRSLDEIEGVVYGLENLIEL